MGGDRFISSSGCGWISISDYNEFRDDMTDKQAVEDIQNEKVRKKQERLEYINKLKTIEMVNTLPVKTAIQKYRDQVVGNNVENSDRWILKTLTQEYSGVIKLEKSRTNGYVPKK